MSISPEQLTNGNGTVREFWREYFSETLRHIVNEQLNEAILKLKVSKAELAKRLGKRPEQITRWLSSPCNLELDTLSDLALALGLQVDVQLDPLGDGLRSKGGSPASSTVVVVDVSNHKLIQEEPNSLKSGDHVAL